MADIDLFDNWFRVADKDRDGVVSGMEAVEFFQRSQLPQATLFKVPAQGASYISLNPPDCDCLLVTVCIIRLQSVAGYDFYNPFASMHTGLELGGRGEPINQQAPVL